MLSFIKSFAISVEMVIYSPFNVLLVNYLNLFSYTNHAILDISNFVMVFFLHMAEFGVLIFCLVVLHLISHVILAWNYSFR